MLAWEKQPGESARAFEAFALYRDMGPARSISKVAQELVKSRSLISRWSSANDWVDRVEALEARDAMIAREAVEAHLEGKAQDHGERMARLQEQALALREKIAVQALKMAEWPLATQRISREGEGEGGEDVTYIFTPAGWNKGTVVSYLNAISGDRSEIPEDELEYDLSDLSEEEMREYLRIHSKVQPVRRHRDA